MAQPSLSEVQGALLADERLLQLLLQAQVRHVCFLRRRMPPMLAAGMLLP
jgi:hypothetical protein